MKHRQVWAGRGMGFLLLVLGPACVYAQTDKQAFEQGQKLLAKGDFDGALSAYARAVQANRENQDYVQQYALVRRIVQMRRELDQERDPQRWEYLAQGLHAFYVSQRLYSETLELDRKAHARLKTTASAVTLAETLLAMNRDAEAAETLRQIAPEQATAQSRALLGLALARQGRLDEARQIARGVELPAEASVGTLYTAARLQAMIGDQSNALASLKRCLESLPPSRQESFRKHAQLCPDFSSLRQSPRFAQALETPSKVAESPCSGGSSCAGCPMRGKCPHSQGGQ